MLGRGPERFQKPLILGYDSRGQADDLKCGSLSWSSRAIDCAYHFHLDVLSKAFKLPPGRLLRFSQSRECGGLGFAGCRTTSRFFANLSVNGFEDNR